MGLERFGELRADQSVALRQPTREVGGSEDQIPKRKDSREVFVESFPVGRVVPPVIGGTHEKPTKGAKVPAYVGMKKHDIEGDERDDIENGRPRKPECDQRKHLTRTSDEVVQGMHARGREPIHLLRRMVDRMNPPERSDVQKAVGPVVQKVREKKNLDCLKPVRLKGEGAKPAEHLRRGQIGHSSDPCSRKEESAEEQSRDGPAQQWRRKPVEEIERQFFAKNQPLRMGGSEIFQRREESSGDDRETENLQDTLSIRKERGDSYEEFR